MNLLKINQNSFIELKSISWSIILGNISVFLFFSLLLPTKSGHSFAIVFALLASALTLPQWEFKKIPKEFFSISLFFIFLALFWGHTFDGLLTFSLKGDYILRYLLGVFLFIGFYKIKIHPRFIIYGIAIDSIFSSIIGIHQYNTIGRAEGFTNAIRFGDLSILMGLILLSASMIQFFSKKERLFFAAASFCGLLASVLSLSRGGWPILITIPFIFFYLLDKNKKIKLFSGLLLVPLFFIFINLPPVKSRIQEASEQVNGYFHENEKYVNTSLGVRLELWKTAFLMGQEKPLTGWGDKNITAGRLEYVKKSIAAPAIMKYNHAHNDFLEMWARRGIIGILALISIYSIPIILLLISYKKNKNSTPELASINKFLLISGLLIYSGYFIFGLSDVFFTFVIGHNFYLFSLIFLLSAFSWIEKKNQLNGNEDKST